MASEATASGTQARSTPTASTNLQKLAADADRQTTKQKQPDVVSQDGFDYVLDAMNGEDNMKEETKDYKPAKSSNFRFSLFRRGGGE